MNSVEINGSFYSLQRPTSYERWRDATPRDFTFAVKGGRYLTHMVAPEQTADGLQRFWDSGVLLLGAKLGPILWQLPERRGFEAERFEAFCAALPHTVQHRRIRHAIEPRHPSFSAPEARAILRRHRIALVTSDGAGRWPLFDEPTAGFVYVRLHGPDELYHGSYSGRPMRRWIDRVRRAATADGAGRTPRDAYVYFDNDADGRAPFDAEEFADSLTG